jgi:hypothetical protein
LIVLPKEIRSGLAQGGEHQLDLGDRGHVEARAETDEQFEDFRGRVGLDGIVDAGRREGPGQPAEIVSYDVEIDDKARTLGSSGREKVDYALGGHPAISRKYPDAGDRQARRGTVEVSHPHGRGARQTREFTAINGEFRLSAFGLDRDEPTRTWGKEGVPLQCRGCWSPTETKKALTVVA